MRWLPLLCLLPMLAAAAPAADCHVAQEHYAAGEYDRALDHWRVLAEDGHAHSQLMIGALYFNGQGVARNPAEAARWFRRAADSGSADAALQLAQMYGSGEGVAQDAAEAQRWRVRAADLAERDGIKCHEAKHRGAPALN